MSYTFHLGKHRETFDELEPMYRQHYQEMENFKQVNVFLETLYISNRLHLLLKGILLIGY